MNFDGDFTWGIQEIGRQQAHDALTGANQANLKEFFEEWLENEDAALHAEFGGKVGDYITTRVAEEMLASTFERKILN